MTQWAPRASQPIPGTPIAVLGGIPISSFPTPPTAPPATRHARLHSTTSAALRRGRRDRRRGLGFHSRPFLPIRRGLRPGQLGGGHRTAHWRSVGSPRGCPRAGCSGDERSHRSGRAPATGRTARGPELPLARPPAGPLRAGGGRFFWTRRGPKGVGLSWIEVEVHSTLVCALGQLVGTTPTPRGESAAIVRGFRSLQLPFPLFHDRSPAPLPQFSSMGSPPTSSPPIPFNGRLIQASRRQGKAPRPLTTLSAAAPLGRGGGMEDGGRKPRG